MMKSASPESAFLTTARKEIASTRYKKKRRHVIGQPPTFLSRRLIGASGLPMPLSPRKTLCSVLSRILVNRATSSQKRRTRTRRPISLARSHSRSIWVLLPAPSTPEKLTNLISPLPRKLRIIALRSCNKTRSLLGLAVTRLGKTYDCANCCAGCQDDANLDDDGAHPPLLGRRNDGAGGPGTSNTRGFFIRGGSGANRLLRNSRRLCRR